MAISEKVKSILGFLTTGLEKEEGIYGDISEAIEGDEYPVVDNVALAPQYTQHSQHERQERSNLKLVAHPAYKGYEVSVVEPRAFGECVQIVNQLKENKTILMNLHLLDKEQQQRSIDYVCGASQALAAKPKKVGDTVFVFTPANVTLSFEQNKDNGNMTDAVWNQP